MEEELQDLLGKEDLLARLVELVYLVQRGGQGLLVGQGLLEQEVIMD